MKFYIRISKNLNLIFLFILYFCLSGLGSFAQTPITWEEDFNGNTLSSRVSVYSDQRVKISQNNGSLKIIGDTSHFIFNNAIKDSFSIIQYNVDSLDISSNPYLSISVKSNVTIQLQAVIRDSEGTLTGNYLYAKADTSFDTYNFDLSDVLTFVYDQQGDKVTVNSKKIQYIYIVFTPLSPAKHDSIVVYIDNIKAGAAVSMPTSISGYKDFFTSAKESKKWISDVNQTNTYADAHIVTQLNNELQIDVNKTLWNGLWFYPPASLNMAKYPKISLKAKATKPVSLRIYLWDNKNYYAAYGTGKIVPDDSIKSSTDFQTYTFDYTGSFNIGNGSFIDSTNIKALLFNFNPGGNYTGTVYFEELKIGDTTVNVSNIRNSTEDLISVYPNPFESTVKIQSNQIINTATIVDISGKEVLTQEINALEGQLNTLFLKQGVYVLTLYSDHQIIQRKLIK